MDKSRIIDQLLFSETDDVVYRYVYMSDVRRLCTKYSGFDPARNHRDFVVAFERHFASAIFYFSYFAMNIKAM